MAMTCQGDAVARAWHERLAYWRSRRTAGPLAAILRAGEQKRVEIVGWEASVPGFHGSQSSMLLPSGSMSHANFPYSDRSGP
jgi:hypothetical protein